MNYFDKNLSSILCPFRLDNVDTSLSLQEDEEKAEDKIESPYDRFTPRSLLDRHPSLLRCSPQMVTTTSFMASKFSVSTPNLTKLIQEDSMFEEERKKHEQMLTKSKKKLELTPTLSFSPAAGSTEKRKLSVPEHLKNSQTTTIESDQDIYGSDEYRQRYQSYSLSRDDSFGAVQRRPKEERRAQYPISMAFTDSLRISGLQPIAVDIDIDEAPPQQQSTDVQPEKGNHFLIL